MAIAVFREMSFCCYRGGGEKVTCRTNYTELQQYELHVYIAVTVSGAYSCVTWRHAG